MHGKLHFFENHDWMIVPCLCLSWIYINYRNNTYKHVVKHLVFSILSVYSQVVFISNDQMNCPVSIQFFISNDQTKYQNPPKFTLQFRIHCSILMSEIVAGETTNLTEVYLPALTYWERRSLCLAALSSATLLNCCLYPWSWWPVTIISLPEVPSMSMMMLVIKQQTKMILGSRCLSGLHSSPWITNQKNGFYPTYSILRIMLVCPLSVSAFFLPRLKNILWVLNW